MWEIVGNPISCFDISQQLYHTIEFCRMKNALDCVMGTTCGCRLNFTLWSLRLPAPHRRLRLYDLHLCRVDASRLRFPQTSLCYRGKFTFRHDRSVTKQSRFDDNGRAPVFRFISDDGKERSLQACNACRLFLFSCFSRQGLTHRRRSRRKIAYELNRSHTPLAKIEFARSFRQRRDEFIEA